MKAVIYARCSSKEQSTDNQVPVLEAWAKQRDFEVMGYYVETESAWKSVTCPHKGYHFLS